MQGFLVIFLFVASVQASSVKDYLIYKDTVKTCQEKVGDDVDVLEGDVCSEWLKSEDNKEFIKCYLLTSEQMDEDGNIFRDKYESVLLTNNDPIEETMNYFDKLVEESKEMSAKEKAFYVVENMAHFRKCRAN